MDHLCITVTNSENTDIIHTLYNRFVRPHLPNKISVHNGVAVNDAVKLFDFKDTYPNYESTLVSEIRSQVNEGDSVIIVGGGLGVSTVAAVEAMGRKGSVETYEGSATQFQIISNTLSLNKVEEYVDCHHAIVGSFSDFSTESYGKPGDAELVDPSSLSKTDLLVLDCEGAEIEVLNKLSYNPDIIIVETHGFLDSCEENVRNVLSKRGYEITNRGVESEPRGIYILTAVQN